MGLFRRRRRAPASPLQEAAEARESGGSTFLGPGALDSAPNPVAVQPRDDRSTEVEQLRANADLEDDAARQAFIEAERRNEEGRR